MNIPNVPSSLEALYSKVSFVTLFMNLALSRRFSPVASKISVLNLTVILSWANTLSAIDFAHVNSGSLAITVTCFANLVRKIASSAAANPAPTTNTSRSLKNSPSHVAQYATPLPVNSFSPVNPSFLGLAPVAIITLLPWKSPL